MSDAQASAPSGDGTSTPPDSGAPAAPPSGSSALTTPATPPSDAWYAKYDTDTVGWMENRGMTKLDPTAALENAIKGFRNAEKYVGTPQEKLLKLPDWDKADKAELDQFFTKMGRPADPKGYEINVPDGVPTDYADAAAAKFHEIGLNPRQAKALVEWNNEFANQEAMKQGETFKANVAEQEKKLRADWGQAYEKNDFLAGEAIRQLGQKVGFADGDLQKMTAAIGFDKAMKLFAEIGGMTAEDSFVGKDSQGGVFSTKTPAAAQARIKQLQSDKDFAAKLLAGNADAKAEWDKLFTMAYPAT